MKYESTLLDAAPTDRMFCYLWSEIGATECKFGERWVRAGLDAGKDCAYRIRESLGVRKDLFDEGSVVIRSIWDVSDYAKKIGKFFVHGKVDDSLREIIGFRKQGEVHLLPADEMEVKVNKELARLGQPLKKCGLSAWQYRAVAGTIDAFSFGYTTILSDMCARAGKTLYIGAVIKETSVGVTVVASYVLTSFTSFIGDLSSFEQFKDMELIDSKDDDYKAQVKAARKAGKQVVVFLSLCKGGLKQNKREDRIKFLFGLDERVMLVIDEADYGAWKPGQCDPLVKYRRDNDLVILMTGTNVDRAVGGWDVDEVIQVTYLEMLMEKKCISPTITSPKISNFLVDRSRHSLVVDVGFYQMDLKNVVESARKADPELFVDDGAFLPSWSKFAKSPVKAKGFWTRMLRSVFDGQHGHDEVSFDLQRGVQKDSGVYMMFMPGNMKLVNLKEAAMLAESALANFSIVTLSSINGVTNFTAQKKAKEAIEIALKVGKKVLILATCLAQRSFSVGEISAVFLAYDNGETGATIQKISRGLTPNHVGKIGRIVSLSFDPRRDDKLDSLILQTAVNYQNSHGLPSVKDALTLVLKTVDIFSCTVNGAVKIEVSTYLEEVVNQERISRVVGKMAYVEKLSDSLRECLLNSNFSRYVPKTEEVAQKGKAGPKVNKGGAKQQKQRKTDDVSIREKIIALCENLDVVVLGSNSKNMAQALVVMKDNKELQESFQEEAGMPYQALKELVESGAINLSLIELVKY